MELKKVIAENKKGETLVAEKYFYIKRKDGWTVKIEFNEEEDVAFFSSKSSTVKAPLSLLRKLFETTEFKNQPL
tara:strand:+ start:209 stop:430 length:222 start_codon:yes stop_codon:yes gene_type:complete